jgi:hypothetical protein
MSRISRSLTRLIVGLSALVLTGIGSTAFASVPPPDPAGGSAPAPGPGLREVVVSSGITAWTLLLAVGAAVVVSVALTQAVHRVRQSRPHSRAATA